MIIMNKGKTILMLLLTLALITKSYAQTTVKQDEKPFIEVTGIKEMEIIPDEIYIGIVIREKMEDKIKISIEDQELKLKESLKSLGIDLANLSLSDANADYLKIRWKTKDVLLQKDYVLKVGNATTVGKVYLELEKLEIKDAFIAKVTHSQIENLRKEARIAAIKDAKEKADYLLAAIGEQTGKPMVVVEQSPVTNNFGVRTREMYYDSMDKNDYGSSIGSEIVQFQKIKINTSIYVKFEIK